MDREAFISDIEKYNISDLELIIKTQQELYSNEEMQLIKDVLKQKKNAQKTNRSDIEFAETLFCIVGLLSPISGIVVGIIMLIAGSANWKRVGKRMFLVVIIAVMIRLFLYGGGFSMIF